MGGHSLWQRRLGEPPPVDEGMIQYTRGYLLALEDILKDSEDLSCLLDLQKKIQETQVEANRTLEYLLSKLPENP
jgi:hypothetical protein